MPSPPPTTVEHELQICMITEPQHRSQSAQLALCKQTYGMIERPSQVLSCGG